MIFLQFAAQVVVGQAMIVFAGLDFAEGIGTSIASEPMTLGSRFFFPELGLGIGIDMSGENQDRGARAACPACLLASWHARGYACVHGR